MPVIEQPQDKTGEFNVRDYGIVLPTRAGLRSSVRIFKSPAYDAMAILALSPSTRIAEMFEKWRTRKKQEREGKAGYGPRFKLKDKVFEEFVLGDFDNALNSIREAIKKNHGTYNIFDKSGEEAVSDLKLLGNDLTAKVSSARAGNYDVRLDGFFLDREERVGYGLSRCGCENSFWSEAKGGERFDMHLHCRHVEEAAIEAVREIRGERHHARTPMKKKSGFEREPALVFDLLKGEYFEPLIMDVLIAKEILGKGFYDINSKLLSNDIAKLVLTDQGIRTIKDGRAWFELIRQSSRSVKNDHKLLGAKEVMHKTMTEELKKNGYVWARYCSELGWPALRYQNADHAVSVVMNHDLPFYVVRHLNPSTNRRRDIFATDFRSQDPYEVLAWRHSRLDDRTREINDCEIEPCTGIKLPEMSERRSLRYEIPEEIVDRYRKEIEKSERFPDKKMRQLRIRY